MKKKVFSILGAAAAAFLLFAGCQMDNDSGSTEKSNGQKIKDAITTLTKDLEKPFNDGDTLPLKKGDVTVTWSADSQGIISKGGENGKVTAPLAETEGVESVEVEATLKAGEETQKHTFTVKVNRRVLTPEEKALEEAKKELSQKMQAQSRLLPNADAIDLPKKLGEVDITWESSNPEIIKDDGTVTHKDGEGSDTVKLTATLKKGEGGKEIKAEFEITVYQKDRKIDDKTLVETVKATLSVPEEVRTSEKLDLPTSKDGVTIEWSSDKNNISKTGEVTLPDTLEPVTVNLEAALTKGDAHDTAKFVVKVYPSDKTVVTLTKNTLTIDTVIDDEHPTIALPTSKNGVAIVWKSNGAAAVVENGDTAKRGTVKGSKETVKLTATFTKGGESLDRNFEVTVYAENVKPSEPSAAEILDKAEKELKAALSGNQYSYPTEKVKLPSFIGEGKNKVTISGWKSTPALIDVETGKITYPTLADGKGPTTVKLTATLKSAQGMKKPVEITVVLVHKSTEPAPQDPKKKLQAALEELKSKIPTPQTIIEDGKKFDLVKKIGDVAIKWHSTDNDTVNEETGTVKQPEGSETKTVTLTATLSISGATPEKYTVTVTVKGKTAAHTDQDDVDALAGELTKDMATGTKNGAKLFLPGGKNGVTVVWKSGTPDRIKDDGTVTPPPAPHPVKVVMTATLTKGTAAPKTVPHTVTVYPKDEELAEWAAKQFNIPKTANDGDTLKLPAELDLPDGQGKAGVEWTAKSDHPDCSINTDNGMVKAPPKLKTPGPTKVVLTAKAAVNGKPGSYDYEVSVASRDPSDQETVDAAASKLGKPQEDVMSPTAKIELKPEIDGVSIIWTASPTGYIGDSNGGKANLGKITYKKSAKPGSQKVTLTANLKKGSGMALKTFYVTVHNIVDKELALDDAEAELARKMPKEITEDKDLTLPTPDPQYDVNVTWASDSGIIKINGNTGKVERPYGIGSEKVKLTATLTKDGKHKTKEFDITVKYRNDGAWKAFTNEAGAVSAVKLALSGNTFEEEKVVATVTGETPKDWEAGISHPWKFETEGVYLIGFDVKAGAANTDMRLSVHLKEGGRDIATVPFKVNTGAQTFQYLVYINGSAKGKEVDLSLSLRKGMTTIEKLSVENREKWEPKHDSWKPWNFWNNNGDAAVTAFDMQADGISLHESIGEGKTTDREQIGVEYNTTTATAGNKCVQFTVGEEVETVKLLGKGGKSLAVCDVPEDKANQACCFDVKVEDADKDDLKLQFLPKPLAAKGEKDVKVSAVKLTDSTGSTPTGSTKLALRGEPEAFDMWKVEAHKFNDPNSDVYAVTAQSGNSITLTVKKAVSGGEQYIKLSFGPETLLAGKKYNVTYDLSGANKPWTELVDKKGQKCKVGSATGANGNLTGAECKEGGDGYVEMYPKALGTYVITNMKVQEIAAEGKLDKGGIYGDITGGWELSKAKDLTPVGDGKTYTFDFTPEKNTVYWKVLVDKTRENDIFGGEQTGKDLEVKADGTEVELKHLNNSSGKACMTTLEATAQYRLTLTVTEASGNISKVTAKIVKTTEPTGWLLNDDASVETAIKRFEGETTDQGGKQTDQRKFKNPTKEDNDRLYKLTFTADKEEHEFAIKNGSDTWQGGTVNANGNYTDLTKGGGTKTKISGLRIGGKYTLTAKTSIVGGEKKLSVKVKEIGDTYATIKFQVINIPGGVDEVYLCTNGWLFYDANSPSKDRLPYPIKTWNTGSTDDGYDEVKKAYSKHFATVSGNKASFDELTLVWYNPSGDYNMGWMHIVGCEQDNGQGKHNQVNSVIAGPTKVPGSGSGMAGKTYIVEINCNNSTNENSAAITVKDQ